MEKNLYISNFFLHGIRLSITHNMTARLRQPATYLDDFFTKSSSFYGFWYFLFFFCAFHPSFPHSFEYFTLVLRQTWRRHLKKQVKTPVAQTDVTKFRYALHFVTPLGTEDRDLWRGVGLEKTVEQKDILNKKILRLSLMKEVIVV